MNKFPRSGEEWFIWYTKYKYLLLILAVFIGVITIIKTIEYVAEDHTPDVITSASKFEPIKKEIETTFAQLEEPQNLGTEKRKSIVLHLYLKNPYLDSVTYNQQMDNVVEYYKWKYSTEEEDTLAKLTVYVYDRYNTYKEKVLPRDIYTYGLVNVDEELYPEQTELFNSAQGNYLDLVSEFSLTNTYKINYEDFGVNSEYSQIKNSSDSLSDEEMNLVIKLAKYSILINGPIEAKNLVDKTFLEKYLTWELGYTGYIYRGSEFSSFDNNNILKEFSYILAKFDANFKEPKGNIGYYKNEIDYNTLKADLAENNPKFLAYLETSYLYVDTIEAKKALISVDSEYKKIADSYPDMYYVPYYNIFLNLAKAQLIDENGNLKENISEEELLEASEEKNKILNIDGENEDESSKEALEKETEAENKPEESNAFSDENL